MMDVPERFIKIIGSIHSNNGNSKLFVAELDGTGHCHSSSPVSNKHMIEPIKPTYNYIIAPCIRDPDLMWVHESSRQVSRVDRAPDNVVIRASRCFPMR